MRINFLLPLIIFLVIQFSLWSQQQTDITVSRKSLTWGIAGFFPVHLPSEYWYLCSGVPAMIRDNLASQTDHIVSDSEKEKIREDARQEALNLQYQKLSQAVSALDTLTWDSKGENDRYKNQVAVDSAKNQIEVIKKIPADKIPCPTVLQLSFLQSGGQTAVASPSPAPVAGTVTGKLLQIPQGFSEDIFPESFDSAGSGFFENLAPVLAVSMKTDLVILGSIEMTDGYIFYNLFVYNNLLKKQVFNHRIIVNIDEADRAVSELVKKLQPILSGRDWAMAEFKDIPQFSRISLDGQLIAIGPVQSGYLLPGKHKVRISAEGYKEFTQEIELQPYQTMILSPQLTPVPLGKISVDSLPRGADVYYDSVWKGKTPLEIPRLSGSHTVFLTSEGYNSMTFEVTLLKPDKIDANFIAPISGINKVIEEKRNNFYTSFGLFMISLPIPMISFGFSQDFNTAYMLSTNLSDQNMYKSYANTSYYIYLGGMALSAVILGFCVYNLIDYISVNDKTLEYY